MSATPGREEGGRPGARRTPRRRVLIPVGVVTAVLIVALAFLSRRAPLAAPRVFYSAGERACLLIGPLSAGQRQLLFVARGAEPFGWEDPIPVDAGVRAAFMWGDRLHLVSDAGLDLYREAEGDPQAGARWRRVPGGAGDAMSLGFKVLGGGPLDGGVALVGADQAGGLGGASMRAGRFRPLSELPVVTGAVTAAVVVPTPWGRFVGWIEEVATSEHRLGWQLGVRRGTLDGVLPDSLSAVDQATGVSLVVMRKEGGDGAGVPFRVLVPAAGDAVLEPLRLRSADGTAETESVDGIVAGRFGDGRLFVIATCGRGVRLYEDTGPRDIVGVPFPGVVKGLVVSDLGFVTPMAMLVLVGLGVTCSRMARRWRERRRAVLRRWQPAPLAARIGAALIDVGVAAVMAAVIYVSLLTAEERGAVAELIGPAVSGMLGAGDVGAANWFRLNLLVSLLAYVVVSYHAIAESAWGQTLGKRVFALRVVDVRGTRADPGACVARSVVRLVDLAGGGLVGLLLILATRQRQRIGDLLGGTLVVRDR